MSEVDQRLAVALVDQVLGESDPKGTGHGDLVACGRCPEIAEGSTSHRAMFQRESGMRKSRTS